MTHPMWRLKVLWVRMVTILIIFSALNFRDVIIKIIIVILSILSNCVQAFLLVKIVNFWYRDIYWCKSFWNILWQSLVLSILTRMTGDLRLLNYYTAVFWSFRRSENHAISVINVLVFWISKSFVSCTFWRIFDTLRWACVVIVVDKRWLAW